MLSILFSRGFLLSSGLAQPERHYLQRQLTDDHNKGSGDDFCLVFKIMGCVL